MRKDENKSYRLVPFLLGAEKKNAKKKAKKFKKTKKHHYGVISSQNSLEKVTKERKQKLSFHHVPT